MGRLNMTFNLYMLVSDDEYEFPLIICDSCKELAQKIGKTENQIRSAISHSKNNNHCIYRKVTYEKQIDITE